MRYGYLASGVWRLAAQCRRREHGRHPGNTSSAWRQRSEQIGYDLTLVAELNLNDIKGEEAPALDAWSTAAALAAVTERLELMVAVRPTFHNPALLAKQAANIDHIGGGGRLSLNVVSSWWKDEAKKYGVHFEQHDDRYARTSEWLDVVDNMWKTDHYSFEGKFYRVDDSVLQPKPVTRRGRRFTPGGESEAAKNLIAQKCDAYVMHGDPPEKIGERIADMKQRRQRFGLGPMTYGIAAYAIVRDNAGRSRSRANADHRRQRLGCRLQELPTVAGRHAAGKPRFARGLFGIQSRLARRVGGNARQRQPANRPRSKKLAWTCCCCSAVLSWKRWSGLPSRSFSHGGNPPRRKRPWGRFRR